MRSAIGGTTKTGACPGDHFAVRFALPGAVASGSGLGLLPNVLD